MTYHGFNNSDQLKRLEVAAVTGRLPRDLGQWLVQKVAADLAADERRIERDDLLRQAARLINGTPAQKIYKIKAESRRLRRRPLIACRRDFPGLLALAMQRNSGKLPGARQLRRIIADL